MTEEKNVWHEALTRMDSPELLEAFRLSTVPDRRRDLYVHRATACLVYPIVAGLGLGIGVSIFIGLLRLVGIL